ncbi:39S ribosomal protein L46, mitochondrial [Hordeum vulgare]|nr:39S ribosomal protein L46, mitochondrial [Hordeum vulgare]
MLPRLPASLHLWSLRWPRGFSSSLAPAAAAKEGADGKIVAAVVFERLPVVIPKIHLVVYAFQEFSYSRSARLSLVSWHLLFARWADVVPGAGFGFLPFARPWLLISFCSLRKDLQTLLISFCSLAIAEDGAEGGAA